MANHAWIRATGVQALYTDEVCENCEEWNNEHTHVECESAPESVEKRFHVAGFWSYDGGMLTSFHTLEEAKAEVKNLGADGWYIIEGTILEES